MNSRDILLLDSNTIMYLLNGDEAVLRLIDQKTTAINFIVEVELLGWPHFSSKEAKLLRQLFDQCYYYDYSQALKNRVIDLRINYRLKLGDSFIAATAIEYDLTLVSADKVFTKIKDLQLINFTPSITN